MGERKGESKLGKSGEIVGTTERGGGTIGMWWHGERK